MLVACSGDHSTGDADGGFGATGGTSVGGSALVAGGATNNGGAAANHGGASPGSGGTNTSGSRGAGGTVANPGTGGATTSGGAGTGAGGGLATGGSSGSGGASGTGGAKGSGGASGTGGAKGSGGTSGTGGATGTGGGSSGEPPSLTGIVAAQNAVRAAHGVGPLVWDADLATVAQAWAETCTDTTAPIGLVDHNANRTASYDALAGGNTYVGENIYGSSGTPTGPAAVSSWASEESHYHYDTNTCDSGQACGHYTQIVWATTTKVGCGYHKCAGLTYGGTIVCDYAPGGNISGQKPY
jgi:pathogenesis-related protein 1